MAAPSREELDAVLGTLLEVGTLYVKEKKTALLCFGYIDGAGRMGSIKYCEGKKNGAAIIVNKCEASMLAGKPSRLVPKGFYARALTGRGVVPHALNLLRFFVLASCATWALFPLIVLFRVFHKRWCTICFFMLLNCYFSLTKNRTYALGFQGGLPVFDEDGAVVAAFAASGATGEQGEDCLVAGLARAGLERWDDCDGNAAGFVWRGSAR